MLSEEERKKAERLLESITLEIEGKITYDVTLGDIQWLACKLLESHDQLKKISNSINQFMTESWNQHWEYNKEEDDA